MKQLKVRGEEMLKGQRSHIGCVRGFIMAYRGRGKYHPRLHQ
jgi:hypothetical protein